MTTSYRLTGNPAIVLRLPDYAAIAENSREWDEYQQWVAGGGVPDNSMVIAVTQASVIQSLTASCQSAITAGFVSKALGSNYTYGSQMTDQSNLLSSLAASQGQPSGYTVPLWCAPANSSSWSLQSHSPSQIQQVNQDWVAFRGALQKKYSDLVSQVLAAKTVANIQAIVWG